MAWFCNIFSKHGQHGKHAACKACENNPANKKD